jgi:hypothetical protein
MGIVKTLSITLIAGCGGVSSAVAQAPAGATMIVPGVYTTPAISAKCSSYARSMTQSHEDSRRQTLALACAQKLWNQQVGRKGTVG